MSFISNNLMSVGHALPSESEPILLSQNISVVSINEIKVDFTERLPLELIYTIFCYARKEIALLSQVNKLFRTIAFCEHLFREIAKSNCFGAEDWKKYFSDLGNGGHEPPFPKSAALGFNFGNNLYEAADAAKRKAYLKNLASDFMLTLIPTSIKVKDAKGNKEIIIDSGDAIKEMLSYQKGGHIIGFDQRWQDWPEAMAEKRQIAKSHTWVWINKQVIGRHMSYEDQITLVKKESLRAKEANISDLIDTVVSLLMNYIKTAEKCFEFNPGNDKGTWMRVNDKTDRIRVGVSFSTDQGIPWESWMGKRLATGLYFRNDTFNYKDGTFGVLIARKPIDT